LMSIFLMEFEIVPYFDLNSLVVADSNETGEPQTET